jgi:hypothetical protein
MEERSFFQALPKCLPQINFVHIHLPASFSPAFCQ